LLDVELLCIEPSVCEDDAFAAGAVTFGQSVDGFDQLPFRKATHFCDHSGEVEEVGVEGSCRMFRYRDCHRHSFTALLATRLISTGSTFERKCPT